MCVVWTPDPLQALDYVLHSLPQPLPPLPLLPPLLSLSPPLPLLPPLLSLLPSFPSSPPLPLKVNHHEVGHDINVTGVWSDNITGVGVVVAVVDDGKDR